MEQLTDLKAILHSKRANMYYLEYCRVMQKDGRVLYLTEAEKQNQYFNIPIANTTVLLLGTGTSITQAAMRMLAQAGVLVGFCGGGGTPLLMANEVEWMTPQSEYRPTEYLQGWLGFWFQAEKRFTAGIRIQQSRIAYLEKVWGKDRDLQNEGIDIKHPELQNALNRYRERLSVAEKHADLLLTEAELTKSLYKYIVQATNFGDFKREREGEDKANGFLNHGNYLAYGLAATTLWVLGIPHGFAVMHGKTRRGALVFDVADLIKDAIILPWAFICAKEGATEQEFRQQCLQAFTDHKSLEYMFDEVKSIALTTEAGNDA
ncbi:MAG: type I-F CRISPR-associated endonuclease Cas1 [Hahellaceae bacterium]|nr:type I-F CRISPR-associated endonuclease Cas1 [Hahellaceae bacterium]MCP5212660.1 type I-F CRISPR-associated endonuclease Cas1 [Hahellaceae bacterium]